MSALPTNDASSAPNANGEPPTLEERPPIRTMWLVLIAGFTVIMFLVLLVIESVGKSAVAAAPTPTPPALGNLREVSVAEIGVTMLMPEAWAAPAVLDQQRFVISEDGSSDTRTTAKPFLYVVVDALPLFQQQLTFRADLTDPVAQLNALVDALNRDRARFKDAISYTGSPYSAAITRGIERGNELTIILLRMPDGRWIYVGAQAPTSQFRYYESGFFLPATNALRLASR